MGFGGTQPKHAGDKTDLYKLLGVDHAASKADITKAYRKLAREHHPDKGGDAEKFKEISRAHEVLSDPDKRSVYDKYGEEGLEKGIPTSSSDIFGHFFGKTPGKPPKRKTKAVAHTISLSLEQLYAGLTKKMAVRRKVIDQDVGVKPCSACDGRGAEIKVVKMGNMVQQMQSECSACKGVGNIFKYKEEREVLEVHVQRGSPDGHRVTFAGKADELPDADTGDVVFTFKQVEHKEFKRRGADLFVERTISLSEALCGFCTEITHLDGRKLLIKTAPGEIIKPASHRIDPLTADFDELSWDKIEGVDCPGVDSVAEAQTTDVEVLKKACEGQLKGRGVVAFVVDEKGECTSFKSGTREQVLAAKASRPGCNLYVVSDPAASSSQRMMKAVANEGMPTFKNPMVRGNLFLILNIEFPESLSSDVQNELRRLLPPPISSSSAIAENDAEIHTLSDIDPVQSYKSNQHNMDTGGEAYDEDLRQGPEGAQCAQM